ncbi:outer membrane protein [Methylobacterium phyllosphaerae]
MIKKFLLATAATALVSTAASAADLPRRAAPPPVFTPVPVFTWTGFYGGLETTYAFTESQRVSTVGISPINAANVAVGSRPARITIKDDGFANIGGTAGYNYQFTPGSGIVVGVANSIDWTDLAKRRGYIGNGNPSTFRQSTDWLGTLTGRVGYAFDRVMVYGLGGLAYGNVSYDASFFAPTGRLAFAGRYDDFQIGYAYGGGIEFALPTENFLNTFAVGRYLGIKYDALTVKAEYVHYDLGSKNVLVGAIPGVGLGAGYISRFHTEGNLVRVGFNYKFGGL